MDDTQPSLAIACRFIPYDQWLVTHINPKWKVRTVKHWILKKCGAPQEFDIPEPQRRPPSPIVFAQPSQKKNRLISPIEFAPTQNDLLDEDTAQAGYEEDNEGSEEEWTAVTRPKTQHATEPEPSHSKRKLKSKSKVVQPHKVSSYDPDRLSLLRYSTGQLLEEDYSLDWYEMEPFELIEIHRAGVFLHLPREITESYVQPYWEGWVQALRVVGVTNRKGAESEIQKLEWRPRWVVVRDGELSLCKDRSESPPSKSLTLSHLTDLRGAEHLEKSTPIVPEPHQRIICAKFKIRSTTTRITYDEQTPSTVISASATKRKPPRINTNTSPITRKRASTISHTPSRGNNSDSTNPDGGEDSAGSTLSSPVFAHDELSDEDKGGADDLNALLGLRTGYGYRYRGSNSKSAQTTPTPSDTIPNIPPPNYEIGEWIVLDLSDDNGYTSLLRTLHRLFPHESQSISGSSTFVGGLLPTLENAPSSPTSYASLYPHHNPTKPGLPPLPRSNALGAMPFPEWRSALVRRSRKAGLGHIGEAMACVLLAIDPVLPNDMDTIEISSVRGESEAGGPTSDDESDSDTVAFDPSDSDSDSSQVEWEGWMADLHRQARVLRNAPRSPGVMDMGFSNLSLDMQRHHMEPTGRVVPSIASPGTTLSSPSSNESLYRRSLRGAEQRRPSMPTIHLFSAGPSSPGSTTHSRHPSSLSQRPSMPSLGRAASVNVLKKDKGKQREDESGQKRKKDRLASPPPEVDGVPVKKKSGLARGMEKIVRGLDPTLDFVDAR